MLISLIWSHFFVVVGYFILLWIENELQIFAITSNEIKLNRVSIDKRIEHTKFYNRMIRIDHKNNLKVLKK